MKKWKVISDCPLYEVSNEGEIRRKETKRVLKQRLNLKRNGYPLVNLHYGKGQQKTFSVHRLVAKAFLPNPNNLSDVDHIDRTTNNNKVSNLCWSSTSQNVTNSKCPKSIRIKWLNQYKKWSVDILGKCWFFTDLDEAVNCLKERTKEINLKP